jgi:hypothetical protein
MMHFISSRSVVAPPGQAGQARRRRNVSTRRILAGQSSLRWVKPGGVLPRVRVCKTDKRKASHLLECAVGPVGRGQGYRDPIPVPECRKNCYLVGQNVNFVRAFHNSL